MNTSKKNSSLFILLSFILFSATSNLLAVPTHRLTVKEQKQQKKRTLKQTWSKVGRLKWSDLDKKDAWNIFLTTVTVGSVAGGSYLVYRVSYILPVQRAEQEQLRQRQEREYELERLRQESERQEIVQQSLRAAQIRDLWGPYYDPDQEDIQEINQDFLDRVIDDQANPIQPIDNFGNILDRNDAREPINCSLEAHDICEMILPDDDEFREPGFIPTVRNRLLCGHFDFCRTCLKYQIRSAVKGEGQGAQISCPHTNCNHQITPQEIRNLAQCEEDNDLIELANFRAISPRTRAMRQLRTARHNWNLRVCHNCYHTFQYNGEQIINCQQCNQRYCARCRSNDCDATHIRHTNGVYAIRCASPDRTDAKRCPRCGQWGATDDACNHTTCEGCGYQFCWMCLDEYNVDSHCNSTHCETLQMNRYERY